MNVADDFDQVCSGGCEGRDEKAVLQKPPRGDESFHAWFQNELPNTSRVTPLKIECSVHRVQIDCPKPNLVQVGGTAHRLMNRGAG